MITQRAILLVVPILTVVLIIASYIRTAIRESRGRKLFIRETGSALAEWNNLSPSQQQRWVRLDADDREISRFVDDFNRRQKKKPC